MKPKDITHIKTVISHKNCQTKTFPKIRVTHFQFLFTQQTFPWNKENVEVFSEVSSTLFLSMFTVQSSSATVRRNWNANVNLKYHNYDL